MNKNLVAFLLSLWQGLLAEEYSIQRRVTESDNVLPDLFVLPPSMCSADNATVQCTTMGGKLVGINNGCTCECNDTKSTFAYYNNWKCIDNTEFHNLSGCSLILKNRNARSPIITITREKSKGSYLLPTLKSSSNCGVTNKGSNLTCSGNWRQLSSGLVMETFDIFVPQGYNNWYLYTKRSLDDMEGQVIRINIDCQSHRQYCVILKINGTLRCPLPPTPSQSSTELPSTIQIQPRPPSLPITITAKPKTAHKRTSQESGQTMTIPTTRSSILTEPVSSIPDHTVGHISTTRTKYSRSFTATTSISVKTDRKKSASKEKDKSGLIIGALAGIIGIAIIVIAIMVLIKIRKKRKSNEQRTDTVENAGYGRGEDNSLRFNRKSSPDEDEYSYAYNNAAPFVKTNRQDLESHTNNDQEPGSSVVNHVYGQTDSLNQIASAPCAEAPVYNTLEEAVYAKVDKSRKKCPFDSDAPIYNTIEEPEYTKVDKSTKPKLKENHKEPLYNVLEGPQTDDTTLEGLSDEPPCYQVLEGPFSEGVPVYDVLERPESAEAPGSFEGVNPRVYGAPHKRDVQVSSEENIGYDDILYDSVGGVINDQGDIYQELNQSGQQNSDVYQELDYPDKTMYLNELNQTHSNA